MTSFSRISATRTVAAAGAFFLAPLYARAAWNDAAGPAFDKSPIPQLFAPTTEGCIDRVMYMHSEQSGRTFAKIHEGEGEEAYQIVSGIAKAEGRLQGAQIIAFDKPRGAATLIITYLSIDPAKGNFESVGDDGVSLSIGFDKGELLNDNADLKQRFVQGKDVSKERRTAAGQRLGNIVGDFLNCLRTKKSGFFPENLPKLN